MQAFISQYKVNVNLFILTSPQRLTNHSASKSLLSVFIACQPIRFVILDEINLVSHYGMSFRKYFSLLGRKFFSKLSRRIPCLFMTDKCTVSIKADFESIIGVTVNVNHWLEEIKMMHRKFDLDFQYTIQPSSTAKNMIKPDIQDDASLHNQVTVYSNTRMIITSFKDTLYDYLDGNDALWEKDIFLLVGTQSK